MKEFIYQVCQTLSVTVHLRAEREEDAFATVKDLYESDQLVPDEVSDVEISLQHVQPIIESPEMTFTRFELFDTPALLTELRPNDLKDVPGLDQLYRYDLRHGDDDSVPLTLEHCVVINRFATIYTIRPLLSDDQQYREISDDDWSYRSDLDDCTAQDFINEQQRLEKE